MEAEGRESGWIRNLDSYGKGLIFAGAVVAPLPTLLGYVGHALAYRKIGQYRRILGLGIGLVGALILTVVYFKNGATIEGLFGALFGTGLFTTILNIGDYHSLGDWGKPLLNWFISWNLFAYGWALFVVGVGKALLADTMKELEQKADKKQRKKHKPSKKLPMDFDGQEHVLATGTTGSGKTANILNYVENKMKKKEFVAIVDGKGGMKEFDLYTVTKKLAKKYGRKMYVLNQSNLNDPYNSPYNPFSDLDANAIRDCLVNMRDWGDDHYKGMASIYWQTLAQILIKTKEIPVTLPNIVYFSNPENLLELLSHLDRNEIGAELYDRAEQLANGEEGKQAKSSISGSAVVVAGDGGKLFADNEEGWNLRKAYDENAVVVVLLNELKYSDFAGAVGRLVIDDIKALVGDLLARENDNNKSLVVLEEIGVYATDGMEGLLNRARSAGVQTIVSMQTFADTDKISPQLTRQIIGNTNNFLMMLNNDEETVDRLCKLVGTRKAVETTKRSDDGEDTGQSSNRLVDNFILHPNDLKQIAKGSGIGYFYDKAKPYEVQEFKTRYVKV